MTATLRAQEAMSPPPKASSRTDGVSEWVRSWKFLLLDHKLAPDIYASVCSFIKTIFGMHFQMGLVVVHPLDSTVHQVVWSLWCCHCSLLSFSNHDESKTDDKGPSWYVGWQIKCVIVITQSNACCLLHNSCCTWLSIILQPFKEKMHDIIMPWFSKSSTLLLHLPVKLCTWFASHSVAVSQEVVIEGQWGLWWAQLTELPTKLKTPSPK